MMWPVTILRRSNHVQFFRTIWEDCYFISRTGDFELASVPLMFAQREGILRRIWFIWPQGSSIWMNFLPFLLSWEGREFYMNFRIQLIPFSFARKKGNLWYDVPNASCSGYVWCLTAIDTHAKTGCIAWPKIGSSLPPFPLILLIFARQQLFSSPFPPVIPPIFSK